MCDDHDNHFPELNEDAFEKSIDYLHYLKYDAKVIVELRNEYHTTKVLVKQVKQMLKYDNHVLNNLKLAINHANELESDVPYWFSRGINSTYE